MGRASTRKWVKRRLRMRSEKGRERLLRTIRKQGKLNASPCTSHSPTKGI
jgi:hypothetical protein